MHHQLLQRQIKKYLDKGYANNESLGRLFAAISDSYNSYERDRELNDHAFSINEQEFESINIKLKQEVDSRKKAIDNLIDAVKKLEDTRNLKFDEVSNIDNIIDYLKLLIIKKNETEQELILAKELAEKAVLARSEFLSMMSHEIRTPLNAVVGTTYLLMEDNPATHQEQYLSMLKFSAENLMLLINDILDFNKIESGKIELESTNFNVASLCTQVKKTNQSKAIENSTKITLLLDDDLPLNLLGDPLRLGQVLNNLVSNAVKFTKNGVVKLQCLVYEKLEKDIIIKFSVEDNGIGIAKENIQKIFDKFIQASDSTTREYGGTGLGLAISKKLVQAMGGILTVDSELNMGSNFSFYLKLPFLEQSVLEEVKPINTNRIFDLSGLHILLVEDNEFNAIIAATFLKKWNAQVELAFNGKEAIEKAVQNNFDMVLMDLHMPLLNGYDAAKQINQQKPKLPILALTASAMLDIKDKAFESGMVDFVTKPFNPNDLYEKVLKNLPNT